MDITLMTRTFQIEVTDPDADVHELLCQAIHEGNWHTSSEALNKLGDIVTNIAEIDDDSAHGSAQ